MKKILAVIGISTLLLSGCATTGDDVADSLNSITGSFFAPYENGVYVSDEQLNRILPLKSTNKDVVSIIGHPIKKEQLNNKEVWSYPYTKIPHLGENVNETTIVELNSKGIVITAYKSGGRSDSTGNPLVDAANGVN